ncbi:MAG: polysaccharide deacetylase family protein [Chromatiaceae bacterium]|nr:polysaccharide deacetylase family protein [Chromatiaceae bacterium]
MEAPRIDKNPGTYPSGTPITITTSEPDVAVYYTLDGSPPSLGSKRYRGLILLGPDTTRNGKMRLRAIAVGPDGCRSPIAEADFERATGISIRFRRPDSWSSSYIHYWETEPDGLSTQWPGQAMSPGPDGWDNLKLLGQTSANLVFNDAGGTQSEDLSVNTRDAWFLDGERWEVDPTRFSNFLFPGGVSKALVLSMDDGPVQDRRLVELLNRHGIRGTFHLNSGRLGEPGHISADEVASLYSGHEVSTHSVTHPYLDSLSREEIATEVGFDRTVLSQISGADVRGHAYPFGAHNATVIEVLRESGIAYARTAGQTRDFRLPADPFAWTPTCHHTGAGGLADTFFARPDNTLALFFIFGHSWELDAGEPTNSWAYMEALAQRLGGRDDIWNATAIEVADYVRAICSVQSSLAEDRLYNPSGIDLWLRCKQSVIQLSARGSAEGYFSHSAP